MKKPIKNRPDPEELVALHAAAHEFFKLQPWKWMDDTHLFGYQSGENFRFGFGCIIGNLGKIHGLCVYRGAAGLQMYLDNIDGKLEPPNLDLRTLQDCLLVTLSGAAEFETEDREDAKTAGYPLQRGHKHPLFRSLRPGYHPWFLSSPEARFLTLGLQQAVVLAHRVKEDPELLQKDPHRAILLRQQDPKHPESWKESWVKPHFPPEDEDAPKNVIPEALLDTLKDLKKGRTPWIVDFSFVPLPMAATQGAPRYPKVLMVLDTKMGQILHANFHEPTATLAEAIVEVCQKAVKLGTLPQEIVVRRQPIAAYLAPLSERLGIPIAKVDVIPVLDEVTQDLVKSMAARMR